MNIFEVTDHPDKCINELLWNDKLAIAISRELSICSRNNAYCFDHPNIIYEYSLSMLTRKDFPLINELNQFIQGAVEGGLITRWLKRYRSREKEIPPEYTDINWENFSIYVVFYLGLTFFAFVMLIIEKIVYRKVREPNSKPFWRYIEMAIDPYRYFFREDLDWAK